MGFQSSEFETCDNRPNRAAFDYLERDCADVDWTVVRPGYIHDSPTQAADVSTLYVGTLKGAGYITCSVAAIDLVRWMLASAAPGGKFKHEFPNVSYKGAGLMGMRNVHARARMS